MHLTDHAKRRWAERCQGLDLMNEWQSARPLGKKSRQRLRQSCPGHDTRRNHPSYYYRKSKRGESCAHPATTSINPALNQGATLLGGIARCAFRLADESEENAVTGECTSDAYLFLELARALDACDHLSEPEEGYVTDGWYRALVKLRQLLIAAQAREVCLAAHVEEWRKGIALVEGWANSDAEGNKGDAQEWLRHLRNWIGDHCSDDAPTTSLSRLKAQWQTAILMEYHQYCKGAQAEWREPMSAHEWASEVLERSRQAEEADDDNE